MKRILNGFGTKRASCNCVLNPSTQTLLCFLNLVRGSKDFLFCKCFNSSLKNGLFRYFRLTHAKLMCLSNLHICKLGQCVNLACVRLN